MGKRWWRKVTGISNAQRQLSRKIGIPLSGRRSRARWRSRGFWFNFLRSDRRQQQSHEQTDGGCLATLLVGLGLACGAVACCGGGVFLLGVMAPSPGRDSRQLVATGAAGEHDAESRVAASVAPRPVRRPSPDIRADAQAAATAAAQEALDSAEAVAAAERLARQKAEREAAHREAAEAAVKRQAAEKLALAEKDAETLLGFAKKLLDSGDTQRAMKDLRSIISKYPDTKAAAEAKKLVK